MGETVAHFPPALPVISLTPPTLTGLVGKSDLMLRHIKVQWEMNVTLKAASLLVLELSADNILVVIYFGAYWDYFIP